MPILTKRASVDLGNRSIRFSEFPSLVQAHLDLVEGTARLEETGRTLRSTNFPGVELVSFIRDVCIWGGWPEIYDSVKRYNSVEHVRAAFIDADRALEQRPPNLDSAMKSINRIKYLGKPSFASKHLRFLRPDVCPVLDSMFGEDLGYACDVQGYVTLADDIRKLARKLEQQEIENPRERPGGTWFVGDVDMALFAWVRRQRGHW